MQATASCVRSKDIWIHMERDVKRYECNVTLRETQQRIECKRERGKGEIGIVHSTEFIQPNAGR